MSDLKFKLFDSVITIGRDDLFPIRTHGYIKSIDEYGGTAQYYVSNGKDGHWYNEIYLDFDSDNSSDQDANEKRSFEAGMNKAWEVARKLYSCEDERLFNILACTKSTAFANMTVKEVVSKIEEFEKTQIHVGDIITNPNFIDEYILINPYYNEAISVNFTSVITIDELSSWKKTGKHIDIQKLVEFVRIESKED